MYIRYIIIDCFFAYLVNKIVYLLKGKSRVL